MLQIKQVRYTDIILKILNNYKIMIKDNIMKTLKYSAVLIYTLLIISMAVISGCGSTGIERSEDATTSMEKMDNDIKLVVVQLDATNASLDAVIRTGQSDVKKAFDLFVDNVEKMAKNVH